MVFFQQLKINTEYQCQANLNLYDSSKCDRLATQSRSGRHLRVISLPENTNAIEVRLCEDDYSGWLSLSDVGELKVATIPINAIALSTAQIRSRLPKVISFTQQAMQQDRKSVV